MTKIFELVWAFLQVGITAFGGGLSTLPLIEYQLVIKNGWMTGDGFNQLVAISQVTPRRSRSYRLRWPRSASFSPC